jgi:hypothetical protein
MDLLHRRAPARFCPEQSDRSGHPRQSVGQGRFAKQRLCHTCLQLVGNGNHLVSRVKRARPDQDRDLLAVVQHLGRLSQIGFAWHDWRLAVADAGMNRPVLATGRFVFRFLQIVRHDDRRDPPFAFSDADCLVDQMANLRCHAGLLHEGAGHVLEHALQVEFLLIVAAARACWPA